MVWFMGIGGDKMKVGDLVKIKYCDSGRIGVIVEVERNVAIVHWDYHKKSMYYFHKLEVLR